MPARKLTALLPLVLLACLARPAAAEVKIGVFDPNRILTGSKQGQQIQDDVNQFRMSRESEVKKKKDEFEKLSDQYKASTTTTSAERREQMEGDLLERRRDLERLVRDADADIQRKLQKGIRDLEIEIAKVLDSYGKQNAFTVIFSRDNCAFSIPSIDISDDLIRLLDAPAPTTKK